MGKRLTKSEKQEIIDYFADHTERETAIKFNLDSARSIYRWKKELKLKQ